MEKTTDIGIVGCGWAGEAYAKELCAQGLTPTAYCDTNSDRSRHLAVLFGPARSFTSFEEMLTSATLDGVILAVPVEVQESLLERLCGTTSAVLCEKPLGILSKPEVFAAKLAKFVYALPHNFLPAYDYISTVLNGKNLGAPIFSSIVFSELPPSASTKVLGAIEDLSVHALGIFRKLFGHVDVVGASCRGKSPISDASILARAGETLCALQVSHRGEVPRWSFELVLTHGVINFDYANPCLLQVLSGRQRKVETVPLPLSTGFDRLVAHFVQVTAGHSRSLIPLSEALAIREQTLKIFDHLEYI